MLLFQAAATTSTEAVNRFNAFISQTNFNEPTWDLFIIIFFLAAAFIYGLTMGRERVVVILMGTYIGYSIVTIAPFLVDAQVQGLGVENVFAFRIAVFLFTLIALFFLLSRSGLLSSFSGSGAPGSWWQVIIFSILHVGLLISIVLSFIPAEFHGQLAPLTQQMFIGAETRFYWFVAPIIALALMRASSNEEE